MVRDEPPRGGEVSPQLVAGDGTPEQPDPALRGIAQNINRTSYPSVKSDLRKYLLANYSCR